MDSDDERELEGLTGEEKVRRKKQIIDKKKQEQNIEDDLLSQKYLIKSDHWKGRIAAL